MVLRAVYWVVQRRGKRKNWSVDCNTVSDVPFKISIVIPSSDARLIGVISSKKGGGADSAHMERVEGNDAFGGRASEVRRRTLMMTMVGAPAVSAGACVGTVTTVVSWVFAMAFEAVWVGRKTLLSFAQQ